jgi:hypothetical protein
VTPKYNLESNELFSFLGVVREKVRTYNWSNVILIPDEEGNMINLVTNYALISMVQLRAHAAGYVTANNRNSQNSAMMYAFLFNSLTPEARLIVEADYDVYTVNEEPSGACFLKTIIGKATVDTMSTITTIRSAISNLPTKIVELDSDIKAFNEYVHTLRKNLLARRETMPELLHYLFESYVQVSDEDFVRYIQSRKDDYHDGKPTDVMTLMESALNRYKFKVENNAWNAVTTHKKKLSR